MSTNSVKICVVGPREGGKTLLCKLLAGTLPEHDRGYHPTKGLRIQEVERIGPGGIAVNVQLRDCSGDFDAYATCFPAMALDMDGLIVVYDPDEEGKEAELERWHESFSTVEGVRLDSKQVLVVGIHRGRGGEGAPPKFPITGKLTKLPNAVVEVSGDDVAGSARRGGVEVDKCVQHVVTKKRELEENKFLG